MSNIALMLITTLVVAVIASTTFGTSTVNPSNIYEAGDELVAFADQYYAGFWTQVIGSLISAVGLGLTVSNPDSVGMGGILMLVGGIVELYGIYEQFTSFGKIKEAGKKLKSAAIGIGG